MYLPANGTKPFDYSPVYECRTGFDSDYQVDWVIVRAGCCKDIKKFFQYSRNPETRKNLQRSQYRRFAGCLSGVGRMVLLQQPALLSWSLWLGGSMPAGLRRARAFDQRLQVKHHCISFMLIFQAARQQSLGIRALRQASQKICSIRQLAAGIRVVTLRATADKDPLPLISVILRLGWLLCHRGQCQRDHRHEQKDFDQTLHNSSVGRNKCVQDHGTPNDSSCPNQTREIGLGAVCIFCVRYP